ncbi:MAG TPA: endonuclease III [Deltaproteobacteria bacterium]|nr:MAG: endonuclease III [Deltaproteobacteria bacterium GWA2_45_12]HBF13701.1 endonuclease III [Deltaproteobacteria bacterium]
MNNKNSTQKMSWVLKNLRKVYPQAKTALCYSDPLQLLVATILSAQSTDKQINKLTPALFACYKSADDFAKTDIVELEKYIRSSGFYHNKAKNIQACCRVLVEKHGGEVPQTMEELTLLPGVGRKTANVVLSNAYGQNVGICVDTHVARLANRLGFSKTPNAVKVEQDLMKLTPKKYWRDVTDLLITHGRQVCLARRPKCGECVVRGKCDYYGRVRAG